MQIEEAARRDWLIKLQKTNRRWYIDGKFLIMSNLRLWDSVSGLASMNEPAGV
jgi:hypothetical protein